MPQIGELAKVQLIQEGDNWITGYYPANPKAALAILEPDIRRAGFEYRGIAEGPDWEATVFDSDEWSIYVFNRSQEGIRPRHDETEVAFERK